jgi:hypothetical protein
MARVQDWHRPRQVQRRWGPRERTPRPVVDGRAAPDTRSTAAKPTATAGKYGEGQDASTRKEQAKTGAATSATGLRSLFLCFFFFR